MTCTSFGELMNLIETEKELNRSFVDIPKTNFINDWDKNLIKLGYVVLYTYSDYVRIFFNYKEYLKFLDLQNHHQLADELNSLYRLEMNKWK